MTDGKASGTEAERAHGPARAARRASRSQLPAVLGAAVIIVAGFGIALVEAYRLPKGSVWVVAGAAIVVLVLIRVLGRRRGGR